MIAYDYDSNAILADLAEPMTSRTGPALLAAYNCIHQTLTLRGLQPKLQRLDNKASTALEQYMLDEGVDFSSHPLERTGAMLQNVRFALSKTISLPSFAVPIPNFLYACWIASCPKLSQP
jgi:hypothetical protein